MLFTSLIKIFPLWVSGGIVLLALLLAREVGIRLYRLQGKQGKMGDESRDIQAQVVISILGLLALLMGFTFSMALDQYELRRHLVVEEANAISTTYLRAGLLDEPYQSRLQRRIRDYADARIQVFAGRHPEGEACALKRASAMQPAIWAAMKEAVTPIPGAQVTGTLINATNQMFDLASERRAVREMRIPPIVFELLIWYALIAAALKGFTLDTADNHPVSGWLLQVLIALVIGLIADLGNSTQGVIMVDQKPMLDMRDSLR